MIQQICKQKFNITDFLGTVSGHWKVRNVTTSLLFMNVFF